MIYHEDCYDTLQRLNDGSVDLLLQDTPFGVTQNDWDIAPDLMSMWPHWERVCKPNAAMIFFATQPFASDLINSNRKLFRYDLIWYKQLGTGFLNANRMPMRNHEHVLVFYRLLPTYNPQMMVGRMKDKGRQSTKERVKPNNYGNFKDLPRKANNLYHPESVINFTNGDNTQQNDHPTQKPLDLIRYLILTYSNPGGLVFDGYMGSGTTAIAAMMEDRRYCGSEMNAEYYAICQRRVAQQAQKQTLFR